jgi:hypothetical protein
MEWISKRLRPLFEIKCNYEWPMNINISSGSISLSVHDKISQNASSLDWDTVT